MALKYLVPLINQNGGAVTEDQLAQDFLNYQRTIDLTHFQPTGDFRHVKREERETIVAMVAMPGLAELFARLSAKYGVQLPVQPAHITLYALQPDAGIGLFSQAELERDSTPISLPELKFL